MPTLFLPTFEYVAALPLLHIYCYLWSNRVIELGGSSNLIYILYNIIIIIVTYNIINDLIAHNTTLYNHIFISSLLRLIFFDTIIIIEI